MVTLLTGNYQDHTKNFFHHQILSHPSQYWVLPEKNYRDYLIKNNVEFPGVIKSRKNHVKFLGILVLGLKISEGCNTTLTSFQGSSFALSGIFRGKVKTPKIPGKFSKNLLKHFGKLGWKRVLKKLFGLVLMSLCLKR